MEKQKSHCLSTVALMRRGKFIQLKNPEDQISDSDPKKDSPEQ
jgi:hypothetical protein